LLRVENPFKVDWGHFLSTIPIVRGSISDRPWGLTLGALGTERRCCELTIRAGDRTHTVTFDRGFVVASTSPLAVDSALRVALTAHIVSSLRANQVKRALAIAPANLDELEVLGAAAQLTGEQLANLRQRILLQRTARTFALDQATYEIAEREPLSTPPALNVDIAAAIYLGVRMNLSDVRLAYDMRQLGTHFVLKPDAVDTIDRFGFGRAEQPIIDALIVGTSLPELEATFRDIDPRTTQSLVYALAACDAVVETRTRDVVAAVAPPARATRHSDFDNRPSTEERVRDAIATLERGDMLPPAEFAVPEATPHILAKPRTATVPPQSDLVVKFVANPTGMRIDTPIELPVVAAAEERSSPIPVSLDPHSIDTRPVTMPPTARTRTKTPAPVKDSFEVPTFVAPPSVISELIDKSAKPREQDPFEVSTFVAPPSLISDLIEKAVPPESERPKKARSMLDSFRTGASTTVRPNALSRSELLAFIAERSGMLEAGVDHFTLLGLPIAAPIEQVHAAYIEIARNLHPKRLAELKITDDGFHAARLLAQIGIAFTVLTDRVLRPEYIETVRRSQRKK
jgi:hypothetical protein